MAFSFKELIKNPSMENAFKFMGENQNSATIVTCAVAVFKGIFRPTFTMMDKKSDPETKKYAAIREGLTEVAAIPLYIAIPYAVKKVIELKFPNSEFKDRMVMNGKFIGLCAATIIIPAVCNVIQPPIMNAYKKRQDAKKAKLNEAQPQLATVKNQAQAPQVKPVQQTFKGRVNYGMKVGG